VENCDTSLEFHLNPKANNNQSSIWFIAIT
jgi:hypothetical protein